jgi:hypothetical protein
MKQFISKYKIWFGVLSFLLNAIAIPEILEYFNKPDKPDLRFYVRAEYLIALTDVKIDSLSIRYKNSDISKDSMNLLRATIKVCNISKANIKESDYTSEPFGIKIKGCKIIRVELNKDDNNHLLQILRPHIADSETVELNKIPFDSKESAIFTVYLLYRRHNAPTIANYLAIGKITGANLFQVEDHEPEPPIDWMLILVIIAIEIPILTLYILAIIFIPRLYRKMKIMKKIDPDGVKDRKTDITPVEKLFIQFYVKLGKKDFISLIKGLVKGDDYLKDENECIDAYNKINELRMGRRFSRKIKNNSPFAQSYKALIENNFLKEENGGFIITQELKDEAEKMKVKFHF